MIIAQTFFSFFTDPILRGPTLGCMFMCLTASLIGVLVVLRRQSLIGEALSHAAYPGVILGVIMAGMFSLTESQDFELSVFVLIGAFLTSLAGLWAIHALEKRLHVPSDAALCFVLSTFFGIGLTLASDVQFTFTGLYKQALTYLYGQAATMTDIHIKIYGVLALLVIAMIFLFYKELQMITFDRQYAKSLGLNVKTIDTILFLLIVFAVIIGIRSVGVVLMSAMLIAPAIAARQLTHRFSILFILSACFGMLSGFFGNYFSVLLTEFFFLSSPSLRIILPTGPMIVLVATAICMTSLLLAPDRGLLVRLIRIAQFRYTCLCENILKIVWRNHEENGMSLKQIARYQTISNPYLKFILWRMARNGWIESTGEDLYRLTLDGRQRAVKIVRLHRLWEVYLASYMGVGRDKVHRNAEEMEHILTPELERELTLLLNDPAQDPHQQPIPKREEGVHDF